MEPPSKKRRHGPSSQKDAQDEDDDDELASHPQEIKIRRDPDIQFALKRANANQKLHATMAHIIEKYSRDFEGIGDEIDMATGEIVVNNGHLSNMRDEGDVEGLWVEGDSNIDEDEGILLEDLTDENSDNEGQVSEIHDSQTDNESNQAPTIKEHTGAHPQDEGGGIGEASSNVSNTPGCQNGSPQDSSTGFPSKLPRDDPPLSPPSFMPEPSLSFGMPLPGFGPWGMMPGFHMQGWGRDDIPPYFNMPPSTPGPWYTGGRYEFPSTSGQASIWGRNWTRKTKRAGSMKGSFKKASDQQLRDTPISIGEEAPDGTHRPEAKSMEGKTDTQGASLSEQTLTASDEDDDFLYSRIPDSTPMSQSRPVLSNDKLLFENGRVNDTSDKTLEETNATFVKGLRQPDDKDDSSRRRSGRTRKQTEHMGKISWEDVRESKKPRRTFTVRVHRADPSLREEFETVHVVDEDVKGECSSSSEQTKKGSSSTDAPSQKAASLVVADSQDTATPFNSNTPQGSQPKENANEPSLLIRSMMPTMELSDDEAPIVLSRIRVPNRQNKTPIPVSQSHVPTAQLKHFTEPADITSALPKNNSGIPPGAESGVVVVKDAVQSLKRRRGRSKGSTKITKATPYKASIPAPARKASPTSPAPIIVSTTGDHPQSTKRKRGRPRKSDGVVSIVQDDTEHRTEEPALVEDEATKNDQQRPVDEIPNQERSKASSLLYRDLRWLRKNNHQSSTHHATQDNTPDKLARPRRSKEILQQAHDDKPENRGLADPTKGVNKMDDGLKEQALARKSQTPVQEADIVGEDTSEGPQDSELVQNDQALPTSHAILPDGGAADDGEHPDGDKPVENDNPTLHVDANDEAVEDNESLPSLPQDVSLQEVSTPRKTKNRRSSFLEPPSSSQRPHTPRHTSISTNRVPSSRRSLLSFVSDSDSDTGGSRDELTRRLKSHSKPTSARTSSKKVWRPTTLTREVHRTPSKRRVHEMSSPVGTVKTPGGTLRTCGVGGYHCGRDYCFSCI
ncbi:hypothetical protein FLONG3_5361 [Fusarium longipes]|uniref:Uncharacterized protein n=1 Tax=Fusarium longipes TaxID=694270 RepID=A0A395SUV5_9HYPO|nr:hypothetical protein FLONG3_5361 [Fusarium longipes]